MPNPPMARSLMQEAANAVNTYGSQNAAARALGIPRGTLQRRLNNAKLEGLTGRGFDTAAVTDETLPIDILLQRRKEQFSQLRQAKLDRVLTPVKVRIDGPIGISHFGDPHVDDDGTDIQKIIDHIALIKNTEGMFAANIGDTMNNWMHRLARLYSEQSTSAREAWRLGEWFLKSLPWLYVLGGNHGAWSGAGDPVRWIVDNCGGLYDNFAARLNLEFPNGRAVRINARHDFSGHSMWNTVHGPLKAVTMGWRDQLLTCGHKHTSGYAVLKDPANGLISHAIRVSSYKTYDRYAEEKGLPNQDIFCNAVTIIDPRYADNDPRLIHVCFDVEQGSDYLKWLRNKK